jgi:hypothetical protein
MFKNFKRRDAKNFRTKKLKEFNLVSRLAPEKTNFGEIGGRKQEETNDINP